MSRTLTRRRAPAIVALLSLVAALLVVALPAAPASAADVTFAVDTTADDLTADCQGTNGCSLRGAVVAANALDGDGSAESIEIVLGAGTYPLTLTPADPADPDGGSLVLDNAEDQIEIRGAGSEAAFIDASGGDRAVRVVAGTHRLTQLGIAGGDVVGHGGGILIDEPTNADSSRGGLTIDDVTVMGNEASDAGGGIAVRDGVLVLEGGVIYDNDANRGGGIGAYRSDVTIRNVRLDQNRASSRGGGIHAEVDTDLTLDRSSVVGNQITDEFGGEGAGLHLRNGGSAATVTATTFAVNHFSDPGLDAEGSQIWVSDATLDLAGVTLLASELVPPGADVGTNISNARVPLYLSSSPNVAVQGTIIDVAPTDPGEGSDDACGSAFGSAFGSADSLGGNVFSADCPLFDGSAGDIQADPLLAPLTGSGIQRYAEPQAGSSAIGNWTDCGTGLLDQRSLARPAGNCTSGAIEVADAGTPPVADAGGPYTVEEGNTITLDGSGSSDEEGPITFAWTVDDGDLDDPTAEQPTYDAAGVTPGTVTVQLTVTDDDGNAATQSTTIEVTAADGETPSDDGPSEDAPEDASEDVSTDTDPGDSDDEVTEVEADSDDADAEPTLPDTGLSTAALVLIALFAVLAGAVMLGRPAAVPPR